MKILVLLVLLVVSGVSSATAGKLLVVVASESGPRVAATLRQRADFLAVPISLGSEKADPAERFTTLREAKTALAAAVAKRPGWILHDGSLQLSGQARSKFGSSYGGESRAQVTLLAPLAETTDIFALAADATRLVSQQALPGKVEVAIGSIELAVKDPEQYRPALLKLIAAEVGKTRDIVAPGGPIHLSGLEGPVQVYQSNDREVELAIDFSTSIDKR